MIDQNIKLITLIANNNKPEEINLDEELLPSNISSQLALSTSAS